MAAKLVAAWHTKSKNKKFVSGLSKKKCLNNFKCADELIGKNSDIPWTSPNIIATIFDIIFSI